jgi:hypothetical protein
MWKFALVTLVAMAIEFAPLAYAVCQVSGNVTEQAETCGGCTNDDDGSPSPDSTWKQIMSYFNTAGECLGTEHSSFTYKGLDGISYAATGESGHVSFTLEFQTVGEYHPCLPYGDAAGQLACSLAAATCMAACPGVPSPACACYVALPATCAFCTIMTCAADTNITMPITRAVVVEVGAACCGQ